MPSFKYTTAVETPETRESIAKSKTVMKNIITEKVDQPIGPYVGFFNVFTIAAFARDARDLASHGMVTIAKPIAGLIFLCGQCPVLPDSTVLEGTVAEKTHLMCQNTKAALEAAGSSLDRVVKVQIFFTNIEDYEESNSVYVQYFPHIPARSAMEVSKIPPKGVTMQLDVIALQV